MEVPLISILILLVLFILVVISPRLAPIDCLAPHYLKVSTSWLNSRCLTVGGPAVSHYSLQPIYIGLHLLTFAASYLAARYIRKENARKLAFLTIAAAQIPLALFQPTDFLSSGFRPSQLKTLYPDEIVCKVEIVSNNLDLSVFHVLCSLKNNWMFRLLLLAIYWATVVVLLLYGFQVLNFLCRFVWSRLDCRALSRREFDCEAFDRKASAYRAPRRRVAEAEAIALQTFSIKLPSSSYIERPTVPWSDLVGVEEAKEILIEAVVLPARYPKLYTCGTWRSILLFGPSGTGKTALARALFSQCDRAIFCAKPNDFANKHLADSLKLIADLFNRARARRPSIIFIDDLDKAFCSQTGPGVDDWNQCMRAELRTQMQGCDNNKDVFVIATTKVPWMLDSTVCQRFEKRVYVKLPDEDTRYRLLRKFCVDKDVDEELRKLARQTDGLSCADICDCIKEVHFKQPNE